MLIYGHRGASADFPEMTLQAYQAAIKQGADGLECDVRLTKDREIICWHDSNTERTRDKNAIISKSTLAELEFAQPLKLQTLFDLAIAHKKNLAIETKHPVPTRGLIEKMVVSFLEERRDEIVASGISVAIMSFSQMAMFRLERAAFDRVFLVDSLGLARANTAPIIGPGLRILRKDPALVERMHKLDKKVYVWTVNEDEDVKFCADLGVDVIMSDKPAQARKALGYS